MEGILFLVNVVSLYSSIKLNSFSQSPPPRRRPLSVATAGSSDLVPQLISGIVSGGGCSMNLVVCGVMEVSKGKSSIRQKLRNYIISQPPISYSHWQVKATLARSGKAATVYLAH